MSAAAASAHPGFNSYQVGVDAATAAAAAANGQWTADGETRSLVIFCNDYEGKLRNIVTVFVCTILFDPVECRNRIIFIKLSSKVVSLAVFTEAGSPSPLSSSTSTLSSLQVSSSRCNFGLVTGGGGGSGGGSSGGDGRRREGRRDGERRPRGGPPHKPRAPAAPVLRASASPAARPAHGGVDRLIRPQNQVSEIV